MDGSKENYINIVRQFNDVSELKLLLPQSDDLYEKMIPYTRIIEELINDVKRFNFMVKKGFYPEHLATEIGLTVLDINERSENKRN